MGGQMGGRRRIQVLVYGRRPSGVKGQKEAPKATHELLDILEANDLFLKPEKCVWEQPQVDYLGLILEEGVTRMDPAKVAGIATWPTPTSVKQVRSFLGFCNFY